MTAHIDRAHAKLSPSSASRWIACPGSVRLSEGVEDTGSFFAAQGSAAHELCEHCLRNGYDTDRFLGTVIDISGKTSGEKFSNLGLFDNEKRFEVDEEMAEGVQLYLDYIRKHYAPGDELGIEERLDLTHIYPETFGTGDCLLYKPESAHLFVIDFKYGKGVAVDPQENKQLLMYGIGAIRRYHNRPLDKVTLVVVQPRAPHPDGPIREWETDPISVLEFADDLKGYALLTEADDAPLAAGDHCKFCPAAGFCPELRNRALAIAQAEFADDEVEMPEVAKMDAESVGKVLREIDVIETWCRRVKEFAHAEALAGRMPAGHKLVHKRAVRRFRDEEGALATLQGVFEIPDDKLFTEPKLKSVAQIEKAVPKDLRESFAGLWTKEPSGTVLAPEDDPRPAVKADAAEEFAE